ncbi:UNVERIFIED_CONTAM: hypothetical protein HDU68_006529, partial [Siphonaria sp. JEL0065]
SPTPTGKQDKGKFIPLMSSIYSMAFCVAAYTQDPSDSLYDTEWYNRVWTLQELVLPRKIYFYRGSQWTTLEQEQTFWATTGYKNEKDATRILGALGGACRGTCLSLAQILRLLNRRSSLMGQDRVYGVLGLMPFPVNIPIDYTIPVQQVWENLCRLAIVEFGDLSMLATRRNSREDGEPWIQPVNVNPEIAHGHLITWKKNLISRNQSISGKYVFSKSCKTKVTRIERVWDQKSRNTENSEIAMRTLQRGLKETDSVSFICGSLFVLQEAQESVEISGLIQLSVKGCKSPFKTYLYDMDDVPFKIGEMVRLVPLGKSGVDTRCLLGVDVVSPGSSIKLFKPICVASCEEIPNFFFGLQQLQLLN